MGLAVSIFLRIVAAGIVLACTGFAVNAGINASVMSHLHNPIIVE